MNVDFLIFSIKIGLESGILFLIIGAISYYLKTKQDSEALVHMDLVNCRKEIKNEYSEISDKILDKLMGGVSLTRFHELAQSDDYKKLSSKRADELFNDIKTLNFNVESSNQVFKWSRWYLNACLVSAGISAFSFLTFFLYGV